MKGWIAASSAPADVQLWVGLTKIPTTVVKRPDVERAFPGQVGVGFAGRLDLRGLDEILDTEVYVTIDGERFPIGSSKGASVQILSKAWLDTKREKLDRISSMLICPVCRSGLAIPSANVSFACQSCGEVFNRSKSNYDLLPENFREMFRLVPTENVSAHPYPPDALEFFSEISSRGGMVLDMGSGDQAVATKSVVCTEIVAYKATDVLAVGQVLPFRDASFDGVYSNAVLEHVTDPFACAEELLRVLKPGGRVLCSVPFLQPEHGYPHHYYNMTSDGLTNLFERAGAQLLKISVPDWGHPLYAGQWFMSSYLQYLPAEQRKKLEQMTVTDFLKLRRSPAEPMFSTLSDEGRRVLACANIATFTKPI